MRLTIFYKSGFSITKLRLSVHSLSLLFEKENTQTQLNLSKTKPRVNHTLGDIEFITRNKSSQ